VCKLVFLDPRPVVGELDTIYPPEYEPFHFGESRNPFVRHGRDAVQRGKVRALSRLVPEAANVLDAGCGSGELLRLMRRLGPSGWRLVGNDFSDIALEYVRRLGIETLPGRLEDVRTDLRFDLVVLNQTIEHLQSPRSVVEKAHELLRPNGVLAIETPSVDSLDARLFRTRHWGGYHFPRHWTLFDTRTLRKLVEGAGFAVESIERLPSPAFWCQSLHHACLDRRRLAWLAPFWTIRNPLALSAFTSFDLARRRWAPTSNMRVVARRA
jgi:SAM-dependent methyltransferase